MFPESGVYRGRAAIAAYSTQFQDAWADFDYELRDTFEAGDRVVAVLHIRGQESRAGRRLTSKPAGSGTIRDGQAVRRDGIEVVARSAPVVTVRSGRIVEWTVYQEKAAALEAVGWGSSAAPRSSLPLRSDAERTR